MKFIFFKKSFKGRLHCTYQKKQKQLAHQQRWRLMQNLKR